MCGCDDCPSKSADSVCEPYQPDISDASDMYDDSWQQSTVKFNGEKHDASQGIPSKPSTLYKCVIMYSPVLILGIHKNNDM